MAEVIIQKGTQDESRLSDRVMKEMINNRNNILEGRINSIPSPFTKFRSEFLGIEQGRYYILSSFTKTGKSMLGSYLFIYHTLMYAYRNPKHCSVKIFYYPLEETKEDVMRRFMSYLLYELSGHTIIKDPDDLNSNRNIAINDETLVFMENEEFVNILHYFEDHIIFSGSRNPSGVWFECQRYADENGTIYRTPGKIIENNVEKTVNVFDHYVPNDPNEYKIIFVDHVGKIQNERGMDERQSICKLSEYLMLLRDRYGFTPVAIQQQAMLGEGFDAIKLNKLRPSLAGAGTAKTIAQDCDMFIGLFNPMRHDLPEYDGYNIARLKDHFRTMEIVINRRGKSNGRVGLFFIGQTNYWKEMPSPKDTEKLNKVYEYAEALDRRQELKEQEDAKKNSGLLFFSRLLKTNTNEQDFSSGKKRFWKNYFLGWKRKTRN